MTQDVHQTQSQPNAPFGLAANEFLSFVVGGQLFGVSVLQVQDVISSRNIAPIPLSPPEIVGSINLRGRIVTAIDLHYVLQLDKPDPPTNYMNVVVECDDESYSLRVDEVGEVLSPKENEFEQCPATLAAHWRRLSSGLYRLENDLMILLDVSLIIGLIQKKAA